MCKWTVSTSLTPLLIVALVCCTGVNLGTEKKVLRDLYLSSLFVKLCCISIHQSCNRTLLLLLIKPFASRYWARRA
jgi:hypothetical protein